jgi:hypothetical protein
MTKLEYEELSRFAHFSIKLPTNNIEDPSKVTINIELKAPLPIELFKTLYANIHKIKDKIQIIFVGNLLPVDENEFSKYILF